MKIILFTLLLSSLGVQAQHSHHSHHETEKMSVKRKALPAKDVSEVKLILDKNDELFNAFLKKDNSLIEKKSQELSALVKKSQGSSLKEVKNQVKKLDSIKASEKHDANLASYESFVNPLIKLVQTYDVGSNFNIFSCPMVKKSWIQNTDVNKGVKNVYAMEMLECGTQDTKF